MCEHHLILFDRDGSGGGLQEVLENLGREAATRELQMLELLKIDETTHPVMHVHLPVALVDLAS